MALVTSDVSRRAFLKGAGLASAFVAGGALAGCAPQQPAAPEAVADNPIQEAEEASGTPNFLKKPSPITEIAETKEFDVVVVGAGNSGVVAALKAFEEGAKVALVQKQAEASAFGFRASGIDLENTTPAAKEAMVSYMMQSCAWRPDRELLNAYADVSGEAIRWLRGHQEELGMPARSSNDNFDVEYNGYKAHFISAIPDPNYMAATPALCEYAVSQGVEFFGSMPGVQLVEDNGTVTGVIAGEKDSYTQFNAAKGVILCTGDYCCNPEMISTYCPDVDGFPPLTEGRDGDGHCMGVWAGGRIEPIGHTKMIHDYWQNSAPFMLVNNEGVRMADEYLPWWQMNTLMRPIMQKFAEDPDKAVIYSIMDANWKQQAQAWMEIDPNIQISDSDTPESTTTTADTIEELATQLELDPATLKASVDRYNELVAQGADDDFGKDARFLAPIEQPPFTAVMRDFNWGLSAILGGLVVDAENRVLNESNEPIKGLYAAGNVSGPFFGGVDYSMTIEGLSIGRAITTGYIAGRAAAHA